MASPSSAGCTPSMGMDLWGESPLSEDSTLTMLLTSITTSRRQGQCCEVLSKGSLSAIRRADEQKSDRRLSRRVELAQDSKDHEFARYSKSGGCVVTDICSCNICISAIPGGHRSCSYLGRSATRAVRSEPRVQQQCRACCCRSQQRS